MGGLQSAGDGATPPPDPHSLYAAILPEMMRKIGAGLSVERMSLRAFMRRAWPIVNPHVPFIEGFHLPLIAEHLEAIHHGEIRRLCINIPPRFTKSFSCTVAFPCWEWTENPSERFLFSSHNQKLCTRHSLARRHIIQSAWYQNRWGHYVKLADDQNLKTEFENTAHGHMITAPIGGSPTGSGGNRIIVDDPMDPKKAQSKAHREGAIEFYNSTLTTRLDDREKSAVILIEQRVHKKDLTGCIVREEDGWVRLCIPIEAKRTWRYNAPRSGKTVVYEAGSVLCPKRMSRAEIERLRKDLGERNAAAQLDQNPTAEDGALFKRSYWVPLKECPPPLFAINVWDTAVKEREENDRSAGLCIVLHAKGFHFCKGVTAERVRFGELKRAVKHRYEVDHPDAVLVEDKSSGQQVIQELQDETRIPVVMPEPDFQKLDKYTRAMLVQPLWEAGRVSYDPGMPGAAEMIEEFAAFPKGDLKDIPDAGVHGVRYLAKLDLEASSQDDYEEADADIDAGL